MIHGISYKQSFLISYCLIWVLCAFSLPGEESLDPDADRAGNDRHGSDRWSMGNLPPCAHLLLEMESLSGIVVIERRVSTCGTPENESTCDIIHVESGFYGEDLRIDQEERMIIGLPGPYGERVVLIKPGKIVTRISIIRPGETRQSTDICLDHYTENGFRLCPGGQLDSIVEPGYTMVRTRLEEELAQYTLEFPIGRLQRDAIRILQAHQIEP